MPEDTGYLMPGKMGRDLTEIKKRVLGSSGSRSRRFKRRRGVQGEADGGVRVALAKAAALIPAAVDSTLRVPGHGEVSILSETGGVTDTNWFNYSLVDIPLGTYLIGIEIGDKMIIQTAFC